MLEQQVAENAGEAATTHAPQGFDQPLDGFDTLFPVAPPPRGEQGVLFTDPVSVVEENLGYRGAVACKAAGITYRQLDYWATHRPGRTHRAWRLRIRYPAPL